jgi:signal transduction histidine kinase
VNEVHWNTEKDLLLILANQDHLEQVFINLLVNARDVIEEKWKFKEYKKGSKKITFISRSLLKSAIRAREFQRTYLTRYSSLFSQQRKLVKAQDLDFPSATVS